MQHIFTDIFNHRCHRIVVGAVIKVKGSTKKMFFIIGEPKLIGAGYIGAQYIITDSVYFVQRVVDMIFDDIVGFLYLVCNKGFGIVNECIYIINNFFIANKHLSLKLGYSILIQ